MEAQATHPDPLWFVQVQITMHKLSKKHKKTDCRIWKGPRKPPTRAGKVYGYSTLKLPGDTKRKKRYAHRIAYMYAHRLLEDQLGKNKHVSHRCHNTLCVNPEHLSLEDPAVNNARTLCVRSKGCLGHGEKKDCIFYGKNYVHSEH